MTDTGTDARRHQFFIVDNEAVDNYDLNPQEGWLYVVILRHINQGTGIAFPSLSTLATKTKMSVPTVAKYLKTLEEKKLIEVEQQRDPETQAHKSNHYKVLPLVKEVYKAYKPPLVPLVKEVYTKNTKGKKTNEQEKIAAAEKAPDAPPFGGYRLAEVPVVEKLKPPKPKTPHNLMFEAICGAFGYDWKKITKSKRGQVNATTKQLIEADAVPDDMPKLFAYCRKQGYQSFGPLALATNWDDFKAERQANTRPSNGANAEPVTFTHDKSCTRCNYGQVTDKDGKSVQCETCVALKEKEIV